MASSPCLAAGAIGSRRALFIDAPSVSTSGASPCPGACCTLGPSTLTTVPTVTREVAEHSASGELLFEDEDYRIIDPEGRIRLNTLPVTLAELESKLGQLKASIPDMPVVVRGDRQSQYQGIMDVLDVLGRLGISQIGLATQPGKSGK